MFRTDDYIVVLQEFVFKFVKDFFVVDHGFSEDFSEGPS